MDSGWMKILLILKINYFIIIYLFYGNIYIWINILINIYYILYNLNNNCYLLIFIIYYIFKELIELNKLINFKINKNLKILKIQINIIKLYI